MSGVSEGRLRTGFELIRVVKRERRMLRVKGSTKMTAGSRKMAPPAIFLKIAGLRPNPPEGSVGTF